MRTGRDRAFDHIHNIKKLFISGIDDDDDSNAGKREKRASPYNLYT